LEPRLDPEKPVTIAVDASGMKVADRGEWMWLRWRRRRGFLKIHIAVDVKTKQIRHGGYKREGRRRRMLRPLVEQTKVRCRVVKVIADSAYDSRENFAFLEDEEIEPAIRVRKISS